jgi:hypothetical protein
MNVGFRLKLPKGNRRRMKQKVKGTKEHLISIKARITYHISFQLSVPSPFIHFS